MAYSKRSSSSGFPTTKKTVTTKFVRADGTPGMQTGYEEWSGPVPDADYGEIKEIERRELGCGCIYPDTPAVGHCQTCVKEGVESLTCKRHLLTCRQCGLSVCVRHSRDNASVGARLCDRCHLKAENGAAIGSCVSFFKQILRTVFWK